VGIVVVSGIVRAIVIIITKEAVMKNTIKANRISGKQKKDPSKSWSGLFVSAVVDDVLYEGVVFAKNGSGDDVKFEN